MGLRKSRFSYPRPSRLRAIRTYLLLILGLTLVLFSLSLISLVRQQETVRQLSVSNLRFIGERIAVNLERRISSLVNACFSQSQLRNFRFAPGDERSPEKMQQLRRAFEGSEKANPIAHHFFVLLDGKLVFPCPSYRTLPLAEFVNSESSTETGQQFLRLLKQGEGEENKIGGHLETALALYRQAENLEVPDRLKSLAAFRAAHALWKAKGSSAAVPAYQEFLSRYGEQYDESWTPYRLALALAPQELASAVFPSYPQTMLEIYRSVIGGQWELSAAQVDSILRQMEQRLHMDAGSRPSSDFLDHLALARAAEIEFGANRPLESSGVNARGFAREGRTYQTFYTLFSKDREHSVIVGFSASAAWVQKEILPDCVAPIAGGVNISARVEEAAAEPDREENPEDAYLPLKGNPPVWWLHIPSNTIQLSEAAAHRELLFLGLSAGMFLCILGLGVFLLIRVSRDIHWVQVRSDFVSGVSHELKTPLSLIRLYSETLTDNEQNYSAEERRSYIRIIARESERLTRLIDNILDFSKIEKGRKRSDLQEGDLAAVVKQTVEDYSEYLALRGFVVKTGIQPYLPPVRFSREQVSQVILNLMDNARKYSGESRLIRVHMWLEGDAVIVEIQDYGFGIAADEREKIFEPFYRVSRGSEKGGCGLGLYLVRNVMQLHGGKIEVQSEEGKGSRFRLYFPISSSAPANLRESEQYDPESPVIGIR